MSDKRSSSNSSSSSDFKHKSRSSSSAKRSLSHSSQSELVSDFFLIQVDPDFDEFQDLEMFNNKNLKLSELYFENQQFIQGYDGKFLKLKDHSLDKKLNALEKILQVQKKTHSDDETYMLIPEKLVAYFIGSKGRAIKKLMHDSNTDIIVSPENKSSCFRGVKITGNSNGVVRAFNIVYKGFLEKKFSINQSQIQSSNSLETTLKFIFHKNVIQHIIDQNDSNVKSICNRFDVKIQFNPDVKAKGVSHKEELCIIQGLMKNVQKSSIEILNLVASYYEAIADDFQKYPVKILIPNIYVTKLIGPGGSKIRQIAAESGGAQIKILSNKESERQQQDCPVQINGSLEKKKDASCNILAALENIKTGKNDQLTFKKYSSERKNYKRSRSRSQSNQRNHKNTPKREKSVKKSPSKNNIKKDCITEKIQELKITDIVKDTKTKFKCILQQKMIQKLTENNNFLLNKIQNESGSIMIIFQGSNINKGQLIELRGNSQQNKNAVSLIIDEQFKLE